MEKDPTLRSAPTQPLEVFFRNQQLNVPGELYVGSNLARPELLAVPNGHGGLPVNSEYNLVADFGDNMVKQVFLKQATAAEDLKIRQAIIAELSLLEMKDFKEAQRLFTDSDRFTVAHAEQMKRVYDAERSHGDRAVYTPQIEIHRRRAPKDKTGNYKNDQYPVWHFPDLIIDSKNAGKKFIEQYSSKFPVLSQTVAYKIGNLPEAKKFDPGRYIASAGKPKSIRLELDTQLIVNSQQLYVRSMKEMVVNSFEMNPVRITGDTTELKGLSHAKFDRRSQETNDLTLGEKAVALTGRNGAGKTHLLESVGLAAISAGSVAAATVTGGAIKPFAGIAAEYRPGGGSSGLSAFGTEAKKWAEVLDWLDKAPDPRVLVLSDEPFSTTDPHEQEELLGALVHYLSDKGATMLFTSHSDVSSLVAAGLVEAYQFVSEGNRNRLLKEGIGDAQSFDVAEKCGFDQEVLTRAKEYYAGAPFEVREYVEHPLVTPPRLQERFGNENPGLKWFMDRRISSVSERDWRFCDGTFREDIETQCNFVLGDINLLDLNWSERRRKNDPSPLAEMLQDMSTYNEADIVLRQEFFERLGGYEKAEELSSLLEKFEAITLGLSESCYRVGDSEKHSFYVGANPTIDPGLSVLLVLKDAFQMTKVDTWGGFSYGNDIEQILFVRGIAQKVVEFLGRAVSPEVTTLFKKHSELIEEYLRIVNDPSKHTVITRKHKQETWQEECIVVDTNFRDRLYQFAEKLHRRTGDSDEEHEADDDRGVMAYIQGINTKNAPYYLKDAWSQLSQIFFDIEWGSYDYEKRIQLPNTYTPREYVQKNTFVNDVKSILGGHNSFQETMIGLLASAVNDANTSNLLGTSKTHILTNIATLCEEASPKYATNSDCLLAALQWLSSEDDILGSIAGHFRAIGGEIAMNLAEYVDVNFREFYLAAKDGTTYYKKAQKILRPKIKSAPAEIEQARQRNSSKKVDEPVTKSDVYSHIVYEKSSYGSRSAKTNEEQVPLMATEIFSSNGYGWSKNITPYSNARIMQDLITIARKMAERGYQKPLIAGNRLASPSISSVYGGESEIKTPFAYETRGGIDVISGSNMSGKTYFGKNLFMNLAFTRATGYVPSKEFTAPLYDKVVYIDRPKQDPGRGKSSAMADFENWTKAMKLLESAAPSFVFIDEPFSSVPALYQKALLLSSLEWLASRGHRVVVATHNHEAMEILGQASGSSKVPITFHNLYTAEKDDEIHFTRIFTEGIAESRAKQVAKLIGGASLARIFE